MNLYVLLALLPLASYRITRLITKDSFPPVQWIRDRVAGGWRPLAGNEQPTDFEARNLMYQDGENLVYIVRRSWSPYWLAELMSCPWCASGWVALAATVPLPAAGLIGWWYLLVIWPAVWAIAAVLASRKWL